MSEVSETEQQESEERFQRFLFALGVGSLITIAGGFVAIGFGEVPLAIAAGLGVMLAPFLYFKASRQNVSGTLWGFCLILGFFTAIGLMVVVGMATILGVMMLFN